ncbi:MAG: hypothetical protein ACFFE5_09495 [Candidatus Thorarchaeota archaeon]
MIEKSSKNRVKNLIFEFFSKDRIVLVLFGVSLAFCALFNPMFHIRFNFDYFYWLQFKHWVYGLSEQTSNHPFYGSVWYSWVPYNFGSMVISVCSTVVIIIFLLGTISTNIYILIKKKTMINPLSRLYLCFSAGIFVMLHIYIYIFPLMLPEDARFCYNPDFLKLGPFLFIIASFLILTGYKVKIKPLLKIESFYNACSLIFFGTFGNNYLNNSIIPTTLALIGALGIILYNSRIYKKFTSY